MHRAIKGGAAGLAAVLASFALTAAVPAAATPTARTAPSQANLPVLVDAAADLTANPNRPNESWYVIAHATAGGHRYSFVAHYITFGNGAQGAATSKVSITDDTTGWYTQSVLPLPARSGLSPAAGVDIHTPNITWTGDTTRLTLHATVPEGRIDVTLRPRGPVLYNMGTGYFPMFADARYPNYEYALPTIDTSGTLTLNGRTEGLNGLSWLDHQWGPLPALGGQAGWTWLGLSLADGTRMSLWKTTSTTTNTWVTALAPDGTETIAAATVTPDLSAGTWTSPDSHKTYPTRWTVTVPGIHTTLKVTATAKNQELGGVLEASATVTGTHDGRHTNGASYVEVTSSLQ